MASYYIAMAAGLRRFFFEILSRFYLGQSYLKVFVDTARVPFKGHKQQQPLNVAKPKRVISKSDSVTNDIVTQRVYVTY